MSPLCLTLGILSFFFFFNSLHLHHYHPSFKHLFFFLEEADPLPRINKILAPGSTQNLLADDLEGGGKRELVKVGESEEGEGGFHSGAS